MALPMRGEETTEGCPSHRIPAIASRDADRAGAAARARRGEPGRHWRRPIPRPRRPAQGSAGRAAAARTAAGDPESASGHRRDLREHELRDLGLVALAARALGRDRDAGDPAAPQDRAGSAARL